MQKKKRINFLAFLNHKSKFLVKNFIFEVLVYFISLDAAVSQKITSLTSLTYTLGLNTESKRFQKNKENNFGAFQSKKHLISQNHVSPIHLFIL